MGCHRIEEFEPAGVVIPHPGDEQAESQVDARAHRAWGLGSSPSKSGRSGRPIVRAAVVPSAGCTRTSPAAAVSDQQQIDGE
jgi:hypothetical protein